ncbi:MAG: hypothetical protein KF716_20040 [Anaerolineae bacterium]|nr:hypothetical protein [Anaerolineae bacterium]
MEKYNPKIDPFTLQTKTCLEYPSLRKFRNEWTEEHFHNKYHIGRVIGMVLDEADPRFVTVFYDGGRRRETKEGKEGIVLEAIRAKTKRIIKEEIELGDLIQTNMLFSRPVKVASLADLSERGLDNTSLEFEVERIIGVLLWDNEF